MSGTGPTRRYRGEYIHGRMKKVRRGRRVVRVKADPAEIVSIDIPEWRIVDDAIWFPVEERFTTRKPIGARGRSAATYALSEIGRCPECGGSIGITHTRLGGGAHVPAYSCLTNHTRGKRAGDVRVARASLSLARAALCVEGLAVIPARDVDGI